MIPLQSPSDGLAARLAMMAGATNTLDLQYYQWESDTVGLLLLTKLIDAADRGVSVRLLVDDLKLRKRTRSMARLSQHPCIEIKAFNPWSWRASRFTEAVEFITSFGRLDRRMHNKMMIADNSSAIIGGRNIANPHFGLSDQFNLVDFDLLLSGVASDRLSDVFEAYWTSEPAKPARTLLPRATESHLGPAVQSIRMRWADQAKRIPSDLADTTAPPVRILAGAIPVAEGAITITHDTPGNSTHGPGTQVLRSLRQALDTAREEVVVVTPFFVPREVAIDTYRKASNSGVRIKILTNSLASNSGTISNSGLDHARREVIEAGLDLHELRSHAADKAAWELPRRPNAYLGLHAKLYTIDRSRIVLGSVNLDPRSKFINTELAMTIESDQLAGRAADEIERLMAPANSWHVTLDERDRLTWTSDEGRTTTQPARSTAQRIADRAFSALPIAKYI